MADALRGVTRLAIDTSALIDWVEKEERSALAWHRILPSVDSGAISLIATSQLVTETLTTVFVLDSEASAYEEAMARLTLIPVSVEIARLAAQIAIAYHLETVDATHVATALLCGCEALLTADSDFSRVRGYPLPGAPERTFRILLTQALKP